MSSKISAGSYDLNKWLYGGYDSDIITTLYGPGGSGKTTAVLDWLLTQSRSALEDDEVPLWTL